MNPQTFTLARLREKSTDPAYLADLRACAIPPFSETEMTLDLDDPRLKAVREKWRTPKRQKAKAELSQPADGVTLWPCGKLTREGQRLWAELHGRVLADEEAERRWLTEFRGRLPCKLCAEHWDGMLQRTPPDLSSADAYFAWSVDRHNEVNRRLGRPQMTHAAAAALWHRAAP